MRLFFKVFSFFVFSFLVSYVHFAQAKNIYEQTTYKGMPGCNCFYHCGCYKDYIDYDGGFQTSRTDCYDEIKNELWHEFMIDFLRAKRRGPYANFNHDHVKFLLQGNSAWCINGHLFPCMLSEYLNAKERMARFLKNARDNNIEFAKEIYRRPKEAADLREKIEKIELQYVAACTLLNGIPDRIVPLYQKLIDSCPHKGPGNLAILYNQGMISMIQGDALKSLQDIEKFINAATATGNNDIITSEIFQKQGEAYFDVGLYHEAIVSLTQAIEKDPKNFNAHFERAAAYFETGDFERSIEDYLISKERKYFQPYPIATTEFTESFSLAAFLGMRDATIDFFPSLCSSAYGLGQCLWAFGEHPIDSTTHLASTCYEMGIITIEYLKTVDKQKLHKYADELVSLYEKFDQLNDKEKGELIGYAIGKYGTEIFAGAAIAKGIAAFKNLREANRICNFEAAIASPAAKAQLLEQAAIQSSERTKFFEATKIHWDKQNKHVPGKHNYQAGKSILEHENPQGLLSKYAGSGKPVNNKTPGMPDYRERVDFGEFIGYHISEESPYLKTPTNKGVIHYGKKGAHIVPSDPKGY